MIPSVTLSLVMLLNAATMVLALANPQPQRTHSSAPPSPPATTAAATVDPCAALLTNTFQKATIYKADTVLACFNSFPITSASKIGHITALKSYFNFYPYLDMAKNTESPLFTSHIDILSSLDSIGKDPSITTEFGLHSAIRRLTSSLFDAHVAYHPACFAQFAFMQPWVVSVQYGESGPQVLLKDTLVHGGAVFEGARSGSAADSLSLYWALSIGVDPGKYVGYKVLAINGISAMDALQTFADQTTGISRTPDSRLNHVLPSYTWANDPVTGVSSTVMIDGTFYLHSWPHPNMNNAITYTLQNPTGAFDIVNVTADWAAIPQQHVVMQSMTSMDSYYSAYCNQAPSSSGDPIGAGPGQQGKTGSKQGQTQPSKVNMFSVAKSTLDDTMDSLVAVSLDHLNSIPRGDRRRDMSHSSSFHADGVGRRLTPYIPDSIFHRHGLGPVLDWSTTFPMSTEELAMDLGLSGGEKSGSIQDDLNASKSTTGTAKTVLSGDILRPVQSDDNGAFFNLDGNTGVWLFSTVDPATHSQQAFINWLVAVTNGLSKLEMLGMKQLIIDVTNNGGGSICAGQALVQYLFPKQKFTWTQYDLRYSQALFTVTAASQSSNQSIYAVDGKSFTDNRPMVTVNDLFVPGNTTTRGGISGRYSNVFLNADCQSFIQSLLDPGNVVQLKKGWDPKDVVIVSNGLCGSTCAAMVSLPFWEGYASGNIDYPSEWIPQPANGQLPVIDPSNPYSVWKIAAGFANGKVTPFGAFSNGSVVAKSPNMGGISTGSGSSNPNKIGNSNSGAGRSLGLLYPRSLNLRSKATALDMNFGGFVVMVWVWVVVVIGILAAI
ncbi:hypothetical protein HDU76_013623 [Blyttiomyces sp. JEL0837]|nr:hypothetical protein HDU76_013623 [Blyttiomyces sp. JEL0837]